MEPIAVRLKACRDERNWSQETLAAAAGIRQSFIGALEAGNQKNSAYLPEIAHALGVDCYWLKTGKGTRYGYAPQEDGARTVMQAWASLPTAVTDTWVMIAKSALADAIIRPERRHAPPDRRIPHKEPYAGKDRRSTLLPDRRRRVA